MHELNDKKIAKINKTYMFWGPSKSWGPIPMAYMALWTKCHCTQVSKLSLMFEVEN